MSKHLLSAAVDAAATDLEWDALLAAAERDPAVMVEWSCIWQWRDARDGVTLAAGADFCSGVMAAIAADKPLSSNVVTLPTRAVAAPASKARAARSWRTLVPLSAAAGVVAAVLFVGGLRGPSNDIPSSQVSASSGTVATTPVSFNSTENIAAVSDTAKAAILNAYLMEHSNSLAERSMGGTLANARFAARTADYRPDSP